MRGTAKLGTMAVAWACGMALAAQAPAPPPTFTLAQAEARAQANSPDFQAALTAQGVARLDQTVARAALLPSVAFNQNYIWTERNIFVANDGPHEFISLGNVHENLDFGSKARLNRASEGAALAQAQAEVAQRGLAAVVVADYYTLVAAQHKLATAQAAFTDAQKYLSISQDRERGGEVAHADVVKAQLQVQQRQRELADAGLARTQAQLGLSVLLFPNFNQDFHLVDDLGQAPPLPAFAQVQAMAGQRNPQLRAAQASLAQAHQDVTIARAGLLPSLTLDYFYGIDAHEFATKNQFGESNLGNSVQGLLNIPLFNWGGRQATLAQSKLHQQQSELELRSTRTNLRAGLAAAYAAAQVAHDELATLASSRDLAAESLRLTGLRYESGEGTILELVDAQNSNAAARDAYDDGLVRYRVALATLQTITGRF